MNNKTDYLIPIAVTELIEKYQKLPVGNNERNAIEARLISIQSKLEKILPKNEYKQITRNTNIH